MNSIERLGQALRTQVPRASIAIQPPGVATGSWWLDACDDGHHVVVEWRPLEGFGVSAPHDDDYGEGADEIYADAERALVRVRHLLVTRTRTGPPRVPGRV